MKKKLNKLAKNVGGLKDKATKISSDAMKTAAGVKGAIQIGVSQSKNVLEKAIQKNGGISQGIEATSKGMEMVAKGAKIASKGADTFAKTMERASSGMRDMGNKLKKKD